MPRKHEGAKKAVRRGPGNPGKAGGAAARHKSDDVATGTRAGLSRASGRKRAASGSRKTSGARKTGGTTAKRATAGRRTAANRSKARAARTASAAKPVRKPSAASPSRASSATRRRASSSARLRGAGAGAARRGGGRPAVRSGYSEGTRRALWIESPGQHAERTGQTLATKNHDVIRRWAEERGAVPATVPGTERDGRPGILRFDFPDSGGGRLRAVDWDEWFETFDERRLVFLFQEPMRSGNEGHAFRLDRPDREEG